jgi:hypothetical protein
MLSGRAQDLADLFDQGVDVVSDPAFSELSEARQISADLRRVHPGVFRDGLRRDARLAHLLGLRQDLQVARQPRGNAKSQSISGHETSRPEFVTIRRKLRRPRSGRKVNRTVGPLLEHEGRARCARRPSIGCAATHAQAVATRGDLSSRRKTP